MEERWPEAQAVFDTHVSPRIVRPPVAAAAQRSPLGGGPPGLEAASPSPGPTIQQPRWNSTRALNISSEDRARPTARRLDIRASPLQRQQRRGASPSPAASQPAAAPVPLLSTVNRQSVEPSPALRLRTARQELAAAEAAAGQGSSSASLGQRLEAAADNTGEPAAELAPAPAAAEEPELLVEPSLNVVAGQEQDGAADDEAAGAAAPADEQAGAAAQLQADGEAAGEEAHPAAVAFEGRVPADGSRRRIRIRRRSSNGGTSAAGGAGAAGPAEAGGRRTPVRPTDSQGRPRWVR